MSVQYGIDVVHFKNKRLALLTCFLIVLLPNFVMTVFGTGSMAMGTMILAFFLIIRSLWSVYRKFYSSVVFGFVVSAPVVLFLFAQFFVVSCFIAAQDFNRFFCSLLLMLLSWYGGVFFAVNFAKFENEDIDWFVIAGIGFFIFNAILGLLGVSLVPYATYKACGIFSEPSHLALCSAPFLFYACSKKIKHYLFLSIFFFLWAVLIQNLTMLVVVFSSLLVLVRFGFKLIFTSLFLMSAFLIFSYYLPESSDYFRDRLIINLDTDNLSVLVLLRGWEYALQAVEISKGWGVGFQQFGSVFIGGKIFDKLDLYGLGDQNQFDGGSTAAKIVGEFGYFGFFIIFIFLVFFIKNFLTLRRVAGDYYPSWFVFLNASFVGVFIELFVRGAGYFTPNMFIFLAMIAATLLGLRKVNL